MQNSIRSRDIHLSADACQAAATLVRRKTPITFDDLVFDGINDYWIQFARLLFADSAGAGKGERIAIVDSGCSKKVAEKYGIKLTHPIDLTGNGPEDEQAHGSALAIFYKLLCPEAEQCPIKIFGRGPGRAIDRIGKALEHAENVGATIVNLSWSFLQEYSDATKDLRPNEVCGCEICKPITEFADRTGIAVFVSQGNFRLGDVRNEALKIRQQGDWTCPASASGITAVLGHEAGTSLYNTNQDTSVCVIAPGKFSFRHQPRWVDRLLAKVRPIPTEVVMGSSYSAALAGGTFAALQSSLANRQFDRLLLLRNADSEDPNQTGSNYNFSLDLVFNPPDVRFEGAYEDGDFHRQWFLTYMNVTTQASALIEKGQSEEAGNLLCFLGDLLAIVHRYKEYSLPGIHFGYMSVECFLKGADAILDANIPVEDIDENIRRFTGDGVRRVTQAISGAEEILSVRAESFPNRDNLTQALAYVKQRVLSVTVGQMFAVSGPLE